MGEKKTSRISEMVEMGGMFMVYYIVNWGGLINGVLFSKSYPKIFCTL